MTMTLENANANALVIECGNACMMKLFEKGQWQVLPNRSKV